MRNIAEVVEDIKNILNSIERAEECTGETLVDIDELLNEILTISSCEKRINHVSNETRLIDATEFKKQVAAACVKNGLSRSAEKASVMIDLIDMQPTAYDVEKVVEQLEKDTTCRGRLDGYIPKSKAIDIVKRGGLDETNKETHQST